VDELQAVAASAGVTAMPTFQFFKSGKRVDEMRGANAAGLEKLIVKHLANSTAGSGAASSAIAAVDNYGIAGQVWRFRALIFWLTVCKIHR
jgi:thioredoxin-like negative regulator of GroEL